MCNVLHKQPVTVNVHHNIWQAVEFFFGYVMTFAKGDCSSTHKMLLYTRRVVVALFSFTTFALAVSFDNFPHKHTTTWWWFPLGEFFQTKSSNKQHCCFLSDQLLRWFDSLELLCGVIIALNWISSSSHYLTRLQTLSVLDQFFRFSRRNCMKFVFLQRLYSSWILQSFYLFDVFFVVFVFINLFI